MASLLYRVGAFAARRHWIVLVVWGLILAVTGLGAGALGPKFVATFDVPHTQSQDALTVLNTRFPVAASANIQVLFSAPQGKKVDDYQGQIQNTLDALAAVKGVESVASPFTPAGAAGMSTDHSVAYATLTMNGAGAASTPDGQTQAQKAVYATAQKAATNGLEVAYVGLPDPQAAGDLGPEGIGILVSLIVLIITFGSLLAAGMPLITAGVGVVASASIIALLSWVMTINVTGTTLSEMIGLAVGIDYALFLVSRHRSNLALGMPVKQSVAVTTATAGSAVLFAGVTVIIALLGLFVVGIPFLGMMGFGAAIAVAIAIAVATTLVPAILALLGRTLIPRPKSRAHRREQPDAAPSFGARWARFVTARPLITVVVVLLGLGTLALPLSGLRLALPDAGYDPPGSITRTGYETMARGFGPGANGRLIVVADVSRLSVDKVVQGVTDLPEFLKAQKGVANVVVTTPNPQLDVLISVVTPTTSPDAPETTDLVSRLRDQASAFEKKYGYTYQITGQTALAIDISDRLGGAIIPFGILVVGLSIILLATVFRSIAVPLTATLGFVLSVAAALGVTTAVFVWGWGSSLLGVSQAGPVVAFMPILVMAVLFGLAMDYEVFLVSRMREQFVSTGDAKGAVRQGFARSARVVTAASLIMVSVFVAFVPGQSIVLQPIAFALAVGVALDAVVVRMTLIPALMTLLGRFAWALPGPLARRLPDVDIEGEKVHGRIATLAWRKDAQEMVVVDTENLRVDDSSLEPLTLTVRKGEVAFLVSSAESGVDDVLAALTGRGNARGMIISCARPLPYDAAHVRTMTSLVVPGAWPMDGSVRDQIREQLRLNKVTPSKAHVATIAEIATRLGTAMGTAVGALDATRSSDSLSTTESWLVDLAVAVAGDAELIAVDARAVPPDSVGDFIAALLEPARLSSTFIVATTVGPDISSVGRHITTHELHRFAEATI